MYTKMNNYRVQVHWHLRIHHAVARKVVGLYSFTGIFIVVILPDHGTLVLRDMYKAENTFIKGCVDHHAPLISE